MPLLPVGILLLALATPQTLNEDSARHVYEMSQESVFLVYLQDTSGTPTALGSAFLVAPRTLVTNAHVVDAGTPVLAIGPVRVPVKIIRKDQVNDLALLSVDIDLTSRPLSLAVDAASPGDQVFAIGNPQGLEKTISEGIVSGIRKSDAHSLIQITSPISHGSSGGPILNKKGEVIGVAVGMLEDGQNLNFAVPVSYVLAIMREKSETPTAASDSQRLSQVKALVEKRDQQQYSDEPSSPYQQNTNELIALVDDLNSSSRQPGTLKELACLGTTKFDLSIAGIKAARTLVKTDPTPENRALLAYALLDHVEDEKITAALATDGSTEQNSAKIVQAQFLADAEKEATEARDQSKGNGSPIADFVLASVKAQREQYADAIVLDTHVVNLKPTLCGVDLAESAYRDLISNSYNAKNPTETEKWFRRYANLYDPSPYLWDAEGDRRVDVGDSKGAADAYERAARGNVRYAYDYCYASTNRYFQDPTDADAVLANGRACIDASVKETNKSNQKQFEYGLPVVYRVMAAVLDQRGVYQQALEYSKESLSAKPDDPLTLDTEALVFTHLEKFAECIAAEQAAVNASDGKYPWMQFRLGYCYFQTENWSRAAASFRIAVDTDKTDAVSAFDLALSLERQGFQADAEIWYREALKRNPDAETRAKILSALK